MQISHDTSKYLQQKWQRVNCGTFPVLMHHFLASFTPATKHHSFWCTIYSIIYELWCFVMANNPEKKQKNLTFKLYSDSLVIHLNYKCNKKHIVINKTGCSFKFKIISQLEVSVKNRNIKQYVIFTTNNCVSYFVNE